MLRWVDRTPAWKSPTLDDGALLRSRSRAAVAKDLEPACKVLGFDFEFDESEEEFLLSMETLFLQ